MSDPSPYVGIRRLFVANRGEVAARVARTCDALGITPVFGVSEADREAPYTRGREVVVLGKGRASESYLDAPRVVQAAVQARCSALHPGWGFLSENPVFASLCAAHGVTFIGPPPAVMQLMGKKTPAKRAMGLAGLSLIPGSDGILADADDAERVAREVGYPVLLKAESGGGGRGMRIARSEREIRAAFEDASAEALACFADDRVYLEKLIEKGRHVEVQLLADRYGNVVHLGERDCSVQRNHQKLIEESPAPGLSPDELARTLAAAVRACQQIGYVGAGTMEFLLDEGGTLRFMEMNTRLQVEHSVSELRSGVDLVAEQIRVASGHRLSFTQDQIALTGHAIECRINAEDPEQGWKPSPGVLTRFDLPAQVPGAVRVDTHVEAGYEVPPFYDSLLCKVITRGATRDEAADRMIAALSELICEGVPTTTAMHRAVLGSAAFRSNQYDTSGIPGWPASEGALMAFVKLTPVGHTRESVVDDLTFRELRAGYAQLEAQLQERREKVRDGWGEKYAARVHEKQKLTTRERLVQLCDPGSELFEVGTFVNFSERFGKLESPAAGVITVFGRVHGRLCMIIANDNTVASGAWWPRTPEKIQRAQGIALKLRLPTLYLVDCSGLYLPEQRRSFSGQRGAGHIFKMNSLLSDAGVPQVAGVFGDCIAGGGYMPLISDRVYMTEQAYMVIAGAALIKGAKSTKITSLDIGGPEVHVHQSGCADVRVPDDETLLECMRRDVARLPSSAADFYRGDARPIEPLYSPRELTGIVPADHRQAYDAYELVARLTDQSLFWEVLPDVGTEMICGVGRVGGLYAGFILNRQGLVDDPDHPGEVRAGGALYRDGIAKISAFSRACDSDGLPILWLQDISGFDIGAEAERHGLLGYGSNLIYTNSTNTTPMFTVLLRKASGAGYYAMAGLPYDPVLQLSTPASRLSVMDGRTLAIATYNTKLDDDFEIMTQDPAERAEIEAGMLEVQKRIEADMDPYVAAAQMDTDEIIPLGELRAWLEVLVEASYQGFGYRRVKNARIWSLHDLDALSRAVARGAAR